MAVMPHSKHNDAFGRIVVGVFLGVFAIGLVVMLFWRLLTAVPISEASMVDPRQVNEAIITMLAGGVGSLIYAIRAYLIHACNNQDFERRFIPWYIFWLFQGSLLGLVFYFAVRGSILFVTFNGEAQPIQSLNTWSLATVGALVGLFSKYAIEKLRQIIVIAFASQKDLDKDE
jgi:hypothetical protein